MNLFFLISIIAFISLQNVLKKEYNRQEEKGIYIFPFLCSVCAMLFFICISSGMEFDPGIVPYAIGFGVSYMLALVCGILAIGCGSLSLTALINSYSLLIPTLYGLIILNEPITKTLFIGIVLLAVSLTMINKKNEKNIITTKWIMYVFLSFAGNGVCSVFQKMQQVDFKGEYKSEFMIISLAIVVFVTGILAITKEHTKIAFCMKRSWHLACICGILNGVMNLFVMLLSNKMPASVMFPSMSAGGIVVTYFLSKYVYKECLSGKQLIGFIMGTLSVIFLSI